MSAQNVIPNELVDEGITRRRILRQKQQGSDQSNFIALGFIILLLTVVIMSSVLIYMSITGAAGESLLLLGVFPFIIMFILLLLSK